MGPRYHFGGLGMVEVEDSRAFPFWTLLQPEDPPDTEFRDSKHLGQYFDGHSSVRIGVADLPGQFLTSLLPEVTFDVVFPQVPRQTGTAARLTIGARRVGVLRAHRVPAGKDFVSHGSVQGLASWSG